MNPALPNGKISVMSVPELLTYVTEDTTDAEMLARFKQIEGPVIQYLFECLYHPVVQWMIPDGMPPYKQDPGSYGMTPSNLRNQYKTLYRFLKCQKMIENPLVREKQWIGLLEVLDPTEASLLIQIRDGKLAKPWNRLTYGVVRKVQPQWLPENAIRELEDVQDDDATEEVKSEPKKASGSDSAKTSRASVKKKPGRPKKLKPSA